MGRVWSSQTPTCLLFHHWFNFMDMSSRILPTLLFLLGMGMFPVLHAQQPFSDQIGYATSSGNWFTFNDQLNLNPKTVAAYHKAAFGLRDEEELVLERVETDQLGFTHYRYTMAYKGVPVDGTDWIIHGLGDKAMSANGYLPNNLSINPIPAISQQEAYQKALDHMDANSYMWEDPANDAILTEINGTPSTYKPIPQLTIADTDFERATPYYKLAWKVDVYASSPTSRKLIYIDAQTGEVIKDLEILHSVNAVGTAVTQYAGTQTITTDQQSSNRFRLRETNRGMGVEIITLNMDGDSVYGNSIDFIDDDNYWDDVADFERSATNCHWSAEQTYDYFLTYHNRNSIDDNGMPLRSYLNYRVGYQNAFWNGRYMTFGDGAGSPFTTTDVVSHEFSHGLTGSSARLVYANEPGALNESFSDIFGNVVEYYADSTQANWLIGEGFGAFRSMSNPNQFNDPATYKGRNWYEGSFDNGGVHINSGVQNRWFYLLVEGGTGLTEGGDQYIVQGIGWEKAAAIAYRNLTVYLGRFSQYEDAREGAIRSAEDLYGTCSQEYESVINAWYAVGIGSPILTNDFTIVDYVPFQSCELTEQETLTVLVKHNACDTFPGGQAFMLYTLQNPVVFGSDFITIPKLDPQEIFVHTFTQPLDLSAEGQYRLVSRIQEFNDPLNTNDSSDFIVTYNKAFVKNQFFTFENRLASAAILDTVHLTSDARSEASIQTVIGRDRTLGVLMEGGPVFGYSYAPSLDDRLNNNVEYKSSTCLCVDGRNALDLKLSFDLRQEYSPYYERNENIDSLVAAPLVNTLEVTVNGDRLGTYSPTSHTQDPWRSYFIDLNPYRGGIANVCFTGMLNQSKAEDNFQIGDRVFLDNINVIGFQDPTNIEPEVTQAIKVFPNPAQDMLQVSIPVSKMPTQLHLFNALGQNVATQTVGAGETTAIFDMAGLAPGMYSLQAQLDGQRSSVSILKK